MTLRDKLREALKARIKHDVGRDKFDPSTWNTTPLGEHYPFDDPLVQIAVIKTVLRESFTPVLDDEAIAVTDEQWEDYFSGITAKSTPKSAIDRLLDILAS